MNKVVLSAETIRKIGMVLGRNIPQSEEGNIESFEGFSEADLNDFRLLESRSGVLAVSYIRYRLEKKEDLDIVVSFLASVVLQGISVQEWVKPR
ncbi:hypothetical protein HNQ59_004017 [Chitinivorax tropicus]|uniref:Uncharacterized protein n=1 Tax=Chitinivorax tropicus TaxID=714531 RepID=A0A840MV62_9PROT|nr:hypothetical protein [Chitinivorax tropicus]MBB5020692.1 hypothetical protein [Chitinivorax tropicus]